MRKSRLLFYFFETRLVLSELQESTGTDQNNLDGTDQKSTILIGICTVYLCNNTFTIS